ncbi:hypothetical protein [Pectinatus sottacetonis]|uniref:hypothetical protein n=1 Tax=Pectinatus sottacetonis TaxID=1002795 RepID=UPI0018C476A2|nr:hypothetical protein [Pectinatus sottacetonis]
MTTLIIIAAIVIYIFSLTDKKKKRQKKTFPPITKPTDKNNTSSDKKTYDYMIRKPNKVQEPEKQLSPEPKAPGTTIVFSKPNINTPNMHIDKSNEQNIPSPLSDKPCMLNILPTSNYETSQPIDITRQSILRAVTYIEVLGPPKSLKYMEQFGIKRFPLK